MIATIGLIGWGDSTVVVGFFDEEDDQDEAESGLMCEDVSQR